MTSLLLGVPLVATAGAQVPPQAPAAVKCGDTITNNTTLVADVGPCSGDGIIVGAGNITLNLNGRTVSGTPGPGDGNHAGIRLTDRTGVTVTGLPGASGKKGTVTGFDAGVVINRGAGNTVENVAAHDNVGPQNADLGDGIAIFESANNRILNNEILRSGVYDGIAVLGLGADNNLIQGNVVADNPLQEAFRQSGQGIVISNVLEVSTRQPVRGNKVIGNTVRNNPTSGISTIANVDGHIAGNTVEGNGYRFYGVDDFAPGHGIGVQGGPGLEDRSARMVVEDNVTNGNGIIGIVVVGPTNDNVVRRNQSFRNGLGGIVLSGRSLDQMPNNNSITENRTGYNELLDLADVTTYFADCGTNTWFGNTWGPLSPLAESYGLPTSYFPECTGAGGREQAEAPSSSDSGPGSRARSQRPPGSSAKQPGPLLGGASEENASDAGLTRRRLPDQAR